MMWIVRLALNRPYTFIVMAMLILLMGIFTIYRTAVDIFPDIDIPVVSVIYQYNGISAEEMERRIVTVAERTFSSSINDIEHIESQSLKGISNIKIFFHPEAKVEAAVAQLAAISATLLRIMPPGMTAPIIIRYSATNVPVLQLSLSSDVLSEQDINDQANNFLRVGLASTQGATVPPAYGGKSTQVMVDLNAQALYAKGLTPIDVSNAINAQNLIQPAGSIKMGEKEYDVKLNSSEEVLETLNNLPIKEVNGATVFISDVAVVHNGYAVQSNVVRQDGRRGAFISILKNGGASTLDVIKRVKALLPQIEATLPASLKIQPLFDQSVFVKASIDGVVDEGIIAACLTAMMILVFLGSWRSTIIVGISIPLSILVSIIVMSILGQTINIMSLSGLALAVGILVDDATVEIENVHRNMGMGKPMIQAILDGAQQIATPAFVSTLAICIVFVPIFFLSGVTKFLFAPLAMAVIFAMLASYFLSRTLIPTMVRYLLSNEIHVYQAMEKGEPVDADIFWRIHNRFNVSFEKFREKYKSFLAILLQHRLIVTFVFIGIICLSLITIPFIGRDFFPTVDAGQFRMHVRAPSGTRIEQTEVLFEQIENIIRETVPKEEMGLILDNIGLSGINMAYSDNSSVGSFEGEINVSLQEKHRATQQYMTAIRDKISQQLPDVVIFYQSADMVSQILNFGLPAPINVQVVGKNKEENYKIAKEIENKMALIPGAVDVHLQQILDVPQVKVNVDRTRAQHAGLTQRDVANNLLISLTSSGQTAPNFWLNPKNGVSYAIAVQTPPYKLTSISDLEETPLVSPSKQSQLLSNFITTGRSVTPGVVTHYNVAPVLEVFASVESSDLGSVADQVNKIVNSYKNKLPRGTTLQVRGQLQSMNEAFLGLGLGLLISIGLVYFLMVVNFQSWVDPLIIISALPGALSGVLYMLFLSDTTFSVPSLMGAIMCIGVATANSILLVTFANDERIAGKTAQEAALSAGYTRLRPVLMTALAMIIGMLPMSLGLGEGGEQNAPLGRAVIGGLILATFTTLLFVPLVYSFLRKNTVPLTEDVA
ncbi:MAG: AcrB/AcrD/AcrF family multidrug efflux protein [Chitinophagaceae bacterium]|nr:AcrB/AcrD/AcrF family multidrug efflux protein [Chitinophagaceae bacterium]